MKVKLSAIKSSVFNFGELDTKENDFINSISEKLGAKIEIAKGSDYDCDLKLLYIETGISEINFLHLIDKFKSPFYLLCNGSNNSLSASLEILTFLNDRNYDCELLYGDPETIANRIKELYVKRNEKRFKKLGVIGKPGDWLISSIPDYNKVLNKLKYELVNIPLEEIILMYQDSSLKFSNDEDLEMAEKFYTCLKKIRDKYHLDGLTIRCYDLIGAINGTGCIAISKLNDEGYSSACEGDIMAMITMQIVKEVTNKVSFQADLSDVNVLRNEIICSHCSVPFSMLEEFSYTTHFESNKGVAIKGKLFNDYVTVFRLSNDLTNYYIGEGKIIENLNRNDLCRTQVLIKMDDDVKPLLTNPCGNHHIIFYGKHKEEIIEFMNKLNK